MANIKTAISIEKPLFEEVGALAKEMDVSRSYLFSLAVREFIQHHKNQKLLDSINSAYGDQPDTGEENVRIQMRSKYHELMKDPW